MKTLIAISTCHEFEQDGSNEAIRETWLSKKLPSGFDYKMFVGNGAGKIEADTVGLDCPDDYENLTWKLLHKLHWALARGYDYVFSCLADTFCIPERLASCGYENFDLMGRFFQGLKNKNWAFLAGGSGFFLSRFAVELLTTVPVYPQTADERCFEDGWVSGRLVNWPGWSDPRWAGRVKVCALKPPYDETHDLFRTPGSAGLAPGTTGLPNTCSSARIRLTDTSLSHYGKSIGLGWTP